MIMIMSNRPEAEPLLFKGIVAYKCQRLRPAKIAMRIRPSPTC